MANHSQIDNECVVVCSFFFPSHTGLRRHIEIIKLSEANMLMLSRCCWQRTNLIIFTFVGNDDCTCVARNENQFITGISIKTRYILCKKRALHNELIFLPSSSKLQQICSVGYQIKRRQTGKSKQKREPCSRGEHFSQWVYLNREKDEFHKKIPKVILIQVQTPDHDFFLKMSRKIHLNYVHIHMLEKCISFIISVKKSKQSVENISFVDFDEKTTNVPCMCHTSKPLKGVLNAKERENGCVSIPPGHIQFISSTSRSKDFIVLFQSTSTNFRRFFFLFHFLFLFKRVFYFVFLYWWNNSSVGVFFSLVP